MIADFVIRNAGELYTCAGPAPRIGDDMRDAGRIVNATLAARHGRIVFVGSDDRAPRARSSGATVIDAAGRTVVPGFVDAHTHVVYAGDRRDELRRRLERRDVLRTSRSKAAGFSRRFAPRGSATVDALVETAAPRLREMLRCGTTTAEVKSGYGLTLDSELTQLRAIRRLAAEQPIELDATFMGAHEVPPEYRDRHATLTSGWSSTR